MSRYAKLALSLMMLAVTACNRDGSQASGNVANVVSQDAGAAMVSTAPQGDWSKLVNPTPAGGMLLGNPNAPVRIIEFASMTCPHCAAFAVNDKPKLVERYVKTGKVNFEFRNLISNGLDMTASLMARCAGPTPQFFALTDGMFADQKSFFDRFAAAPKERLEALQSQAPAQQFQSTAELSGLTQWAAQRGMPSGQTNKCLADQAELDRMVQRVSDYSTQYNIPGTPAFVINDGQPFTLKAGSSGFDQLEAAIKETL